LALLANNRAEPDNEVSRFLHSQRLTRLQMGGVLPCTGSANKSVSL
jgi:hypothetical protein